MSISRSLTTANKSKRNPGGKVADIFSMRLGLAGYFGLGGVLGNYGKLDGEFGLAGKGFEVDLSTKLVNDDMANNVES